MSMAAAFWVPAAHLLNVASPVPPPGKLDADGSGVSGS
jgi:hypothetical protein